MNRRHASKRKRRCPAGKHLKKRGRGKGVVCVVSR